MVWQQSFALLSVYRIKQNTTFGIFALSSIKYLAVSILSKSVFWVWNSKIESSFKSEVRCRSFPYFFVSDLVSLSPGLFSTLWHIVKSLWAYTQCRHHCWDLGAHLLGHTTHGPRHQPSVLSSLRTRAVWSLLSAAIHQGVTGVVRTHHPVILWRE